MKKINLKKEFKGKKILITGATGSIGTAIIQQLIKLDPSNIRILSNDENSLFETKKQFGISSMFTYIFGDIKERDRMRLAMRDIDIVFHAAALKHVDICEQNPFDAAKTNVIGTSNLLEVALIENISKFVFISTDKATNPSSTLGASKLLAERLTKNAGAYRGNGKTVFSIVRFGNVLGSRGSVFQIFHNQLRSNKPLTVTNQKMTRFVMSISEAANLILNACSIAKDGEIHILKMPSVNILDLAKIIIETYEEVTHIKFNSKILVGKIKKGERMNELLIADEELSFCHDLGNMYKISDNINPEEIPKSELDSNTAQKINKNELKKILKNLFQNY